ncbi:MAG: trehalose-phosphatase [Candidatus Geothermincolia bacterium]
MPPAPCPPEPWDGFEELLGAFRSDPAHSAVMTDFDGTISDIMPFFGSASVIPEIKAVLEQLARAYPLFAISGRMAEDVERRIGIEGIVCIGVHGMEWKDDGHLHVDPSVAPFLPALRQAGELLRAAPQLAPAGVVLEDKRLSLSLHWRNAVELGADEEELAAMCRGLALRIAGDLGLRLREGRMVAEVVPPAVTDKGTAVRYFVARQGIARALYMGDDRTDTDVFRAFDELAAETDFQGLKVGIASDEMQPELTAAAQLLLPGPHCVASFLRPLLA